MANASAIRGGPKGGHNKRAKGVDRFLSFLKRSENQLSSPAMLFVYCLTITLFFYL